MCRLSLDFTTTIQCCVVKHNCNEMKCDKICSVEAKQSVFASAVSIVIHLEGKDRGHPRTGHEGPEVE